MKNDTRSAGEKLRRNGLLAERDDILLHAAFMDGEILPPGSRDGPATSIPACNVRRHQSHLDRELGILFVTPPALRGSRGARHCHDQKE